MTTELIDMAGVGEVLTEEQRTVFIEVIEESLRIKKRTHLFNWLQRGFQYLLAHEVMLFGVKSLDSHAYDYEYFTSSRYFGDQQMYLALQKEDGVVRQAVAEWRKSHQPVFVVDGLLSDVPTNYTLIQASTEALSNIELKSFAVHGFGDMQSHLASIVIFGRLSYPMNKQTATLLKLLMPYLHCAIAQICAGSSHTGAGSQHQFTQKVTKRELQVLTWLHTGKTNHEIADVLHISPLTVKNHVQNIIRKFNVNNRSQAAAAAVRLGLIDVDGDHG